MLARSWFYLVPSQSSPQASALLGEKLLLCPLKAEILPWPQPGQGVLAPAVLNRPEQKAQRARSDEGHGSSGHRTALQLPELHLEKQDLPPVLEEGELRDPRCPFLLAKRPSPEQCSA